MTIYVSGAEPPRLRALGISTNMPEQFGADFLWSSARGVVGIQRKSFPSDFLSSLRDNRLGKELIQLQDLDVRIILLEGQPLFTEGGELIFDYGSMTRTALTNIQVSLQMNHGCIVVWTTDIEDTAATILSIYNYTEREVEQSTLTARNGQRWGDLSSAAFSAYLLESVPGVGSKRAAAIVKALGGSLPLSWQGTREELLAVPGVGKSTADNILKAFGGSEASST